MPLGEVRELGLGGCNQAAVAARRLPRGARPCPSGAGLHRGIPQSPSHPCMQASKPARLASYSQASQQQSQPAAAAAVAGRRQAVSASWFPPNTLPCMARRMSALPQEAEAACAAPAVINDESGSAADRSRCAERSCVRKAPPHPTAPPASAASASLLLRGGGGSGSIQPSRGGRAHSELIPAENQPSARMHPAIPAGCCGITRMPRVPPAAVYNQTEQAGPRQYPGITNRFAVGVGWA